MLPSFIIIGAMKSGTTTLYQYLRRHPDIYLPDLKELDFFSKPSNFNRGIEYYKSFFFKANSNQICIDNSTTYSRFPEYKHTPKRIQKTLQKIKFIYIMRNPIDRAYSHYLQLIKGTYNRQRKKKEEIQGYKYSFEELIEIAPTLLESSDYMLQIKEYLKYFEKSDFLFITSEDLQKNAIETLEKIESFLNVPQINLLKEGEIHANKTSDYITNLQTKGFLGKISNLPIYREIKNLIGNNLRSKIKSNITKIINLIFKRNREIIPKSMLPETREKLIEYFRPKNEELGKFLGRDLSHWNQ